MIAFASLSWGQRSNAPEYHKKTDHYTFRFGYYLGINQSNFKVEYALSRFEQLVSKSSL